MTQNTKKAPTPATLGKGVGVGESKRTWSQITSTFAEMEDFAAVKSGGLTRGDVSGNVRAEAENLQQKARRSLDTGIFYVVHAPEKHGESTAILAGSGLIEYPSGKYARRSVAVFDSRLFLRPVFVRKTKKTTEVCHA